MKIIEILNQIFLIEMQKADYLSSEINVCKVHIYSEEATKFCEISTLLLPVKSKVKISQNFVAFSEYTNFIETDQAAPNKMALPINNLS